MTCTNTSLPRWKISWIGGLLRALRSLNRRPRPPLLSARPSDS
jgi:hypothetical protein